MAFYVMHYINKNNGVDRRWQYCTVQDYVEQYCDVLMTKVWSELFLVLYCIG